MVFVQNWMIKLNLFLTQSRHIQQPPTNSGSTENHTRWSKITITPRPRNWNKCCSNVSYNKIIQKTKYHLTVNFANVIDRIRGGKIFIKRELIHYRLVFLGVLSEHWFRWCPNQLIDHIWLHMMLPGHSGLILSEQCSGNNFVNGFS